MPVRIAGGKDELDLSHFASGITFKTDRIEGYDTKFKNFEKIKFGNGSDLLKHASFGTAITTGGGADKIWFADGIGITDLSPDDRIGTGGWTLNLYGGLRWIHSESPWA